MACTLEGGTIMWPVTDEEQDWVSGRKPAA